MRIVLGFVDTPEGHAALERAIAEAKALDAHLVVVHSLHGERGHEKAKDFIGAEEAMEEAAAQLAEAGVAYTTRELVKGHSPGQDVLDVAREEEADLIVIGLRRRTPTGKWLLGSTAQDILLDAPCPVLAVPVL